MLTFRLIPCRAWLLALVLLAGCRSILNLPPPLETRGGFTVPVGLDGQPTSARVFTDVGTFAQRRGFIRQGTRAVPSPAPAASQPPAPASERYVRGKITLDVVYDPEHLHVVADLHSFSGQLSRGYIDEFYRAFRQEYGGSYGDEGSIVETENTDDSGSPAKGIGGHKATGGHDGGDAATGR